jgi:hypothetical protein
MRRVQVADQPERRGVSVNLPFNPECHLRGLLPLIGAVTTGDDRSYRKNDTARKPLMYLHFDANGSAEYSAIAE